MEKDFDRWNFQKKKIDSYRGDVLFKEGEIWWCSVGLNIGDESYGKGPTFRRPILVLKKLSRNLCIGIPLSTKLKTGTWFATISITEGSRTILLYQIRAFSAKRFQRRLAVLDEQGFKHVKQKLEQLLEL